VERNNVAALFFSGFLICAPALGAEASKSKKKAAAGPDTAAIDRRVTDAKAIFIGEGTRIYFVDRQFREVPYIRAVGDGANKTAMVAVKVVKVLHPARGGVPERVLVPIETSRDAYGQGRSPYDEQVARHVGKQVIWFGEVVVRQDYGDDKSGRKQLEEPVTLLQPRDPKRSPVADSLPIGQLRQVTDSIARVRGQPAAAQKAE
jgi:hypothetical protein